MSTNITIVYNRIIEVLGDMFPNKTRITYPYAMERNNHRLMIDGYGVSLGPASFEEFEMCRFMVARTVTVSLTRDMFKLDSSASEIDQRVLGMMEDVVKIQKEFYNYNELEIPANIARVDIVGVSEPQEINVEKSSFLQMDAEFNFFISELIGE
jgi:hypothetical protein